MHISKMNLVFLQHNNQPSFGIDHFCIGKQYALLLNKDSKEKILWFHNTVLLKFICS